MKIFIFTVLLSLSLGSFSNPMTWVSLTYSGLDGRSWALSIQEKDLPRSSLCSFSERTFRPDDAITEASCWLNKSGFNVSKFRVEEVKIVTMGEDWKQCTYIVAMRNDSKSFSMKIGVDLEGNVHEPIELPVTAENIQSMNNRKIGKCTE